MDTILDKQVRLHLSQAAKRQIYSSVAMATLMALIVGQEKAAFLLVVLILPLGVWLGYSLYVIIREPYARLVQIICIGVWSGAILLVLLIHYIRHESARNDADEIVKAIVETTTALKHCPTKLDSVIKQHPQVLEKLRADFTYSCRAGTPRFFYGATFTILDTYEYDFSKQAWQYRSWLEKDIAKVSSAS